MVNDKFQSDPPKPLYRFWIIGGGRFGRIAVERIIARFPHAAVTVVDRQPPSFDIKGAAVIRDDGISWLNRMLDPGSPVDLIVPAIPVHVAAEWIKTRLLNEYHVDPLPIPDRWLKRMPHAIRGSTGKAYVSHADFICPDNCPEPESICTHTGKPRPIDLFRLLGELELDDVLPMVLRSHQLLPGVGGIYPQALIHALERVRCHQSCSVMIATACRCHGVVDLLGLRKRGVQASDFLDIVQESR
jgi:hypothetical protein